MIETTAASFTSSLVAAIVAGVGSPAVLWFALKGKLSDLFMPRPEIEQMKDALEEDIDGVGKRQEAQLALYNQMRGEYDGLRDRLTTMEARQDPVKTAVERMETKLDKSLERTERLARELAVHTEQIRTLFKMKGGEP